ncbi:hypothetical protein ACHAPJ_011220 [Fusarium lateritium]
MWPTELFSRFCHTLDHLLPPYSSSITWAEIAHSMSANMKEETELIEEDVQSHEAADVSDKRGTDGELSDEEVDNEANNKETSDKEANNDQATDKETDEKKATDQMVNDDELPDEAASVHSASTASAIGTNAEADENYSHPLGDLHRLGLEAITGDDKDYASYE